MALSCGLTALMLHHFDTCDVYDVTGQTSVGATPALVAGKFKPSEDVS